MNNIIVTTTFRHFINYFSSSVLVNALGLISIPIFTRLLSLEEYGYTSLFRSYSSAFFLIFSINMHVSIVRYFYEAKEDFDRFFGTIALLLITSYVIAFTVVLVFHETLAQWLNLPISLLLGVPIVGAASLLAIIWEQLLQAKQQSAKIAKVRVIQALVTFACSIGLIFLVQDNKYMAIVYAQSLIGLIASLYFLRNLVPMLKFGFSFAYVRYMIAFSIPMLPYVFGLDILNYFDRLLINSHFGAKDAGIYALAYNISAIISVIWVSLQSSWIPLFYERMNARDYTAVNYYINRLIRCFILIAGAIILFSREIGIILAPAKFQSSFGLIPIIMGANILFLLSNIFTMVITFRKKTGYLSLVTIVSSAISVLLNYTLIPQFGYIIGPYTSLTASTVMLLLTWAFCVANRKEYTPSLLLVVKPLWVILVSVATYFFFVYFAVPGIFATPGKLLLIALLGYISCPFVLEVIMSKFNLKAMGASDE